MTEVGAEVPIQVENKPTLGSVEIPVGPSRVKVSFVEFKPASSEKVDPGKAVLFLIGWPWEAKSATTWDLPRALADKSGVTSFSIDTRLNKMDPDALFHEAEGIRQFVLSRGIQELTIVGHSEGAIRAVNLTSLLEQKDPQIQIDGLVLANPMGFYPQSFTELAKNFAIEFIKIEGEEKNPKINHYPLPQVAKEWLSSILRDIKITGLIKYPQLVASQLAVMRRVNQRLSEIKTPTLLISTSRDFVSDYRKYMSDEEIGEKVQPIKSDEQLREEITNSDKWNNLPDEEKAKFESKEAFVDYYLKRAKTRLQMAATGKARIAHIKEQKLPKVGNLEVLIASRFGSHIGIPMERPDQSAHVFSGFSKD